MACANKLPGARLEPRSAGWAPVPATGLHPFLARRRQLTDPHAVDARGPAQDQVDATGLPDLVPAETPCRLLRCECVEATPGRLVRERLEDPSHALDLLLAHHLPVPVREVRLHRGVVSPRVLRDRHRDGIDQLVEVPDENDLIARAAPRAGVLHLKAPALGPAGRMKAQPHQLLVGGPGLVAVAESQSAAGSQHSLDQVVCPFVVVCRPRGVSLQPRATRLGERGRPRRPPAPDGHKAAAVQRAGRDPAAVVGVAVATRTGIPDPFEHAYLVVRQ